MRRSPGGVAAGFEACERIRHKGTMRLWRNKDPTKASSHTRALYLTALYLGGANKAVNCFVRRYRTWQGSALKLTLRVYIYLFELTLLPYPLSYPFSSPHTTPNHRTTQTCALLLTPSMPAAAPSTTSRPRSASSRTSRRKWCGAQMCWKSALLVWTGKSSARSSWSG